MRILHPQFRDENLDSRYPFTDTSSLIADNGAQLDANWLLDVILYPPGVTDALSVSSIYVAGETLTITIGRSNGSAVCTGTVDLTTESVGAIPLQDAFGRPSGLLLADPTAIVALRQLAIGTINFGVGTADFVASVTVPTPEPGVRDFTDLTNMPLAGDVWLVGENGVQLTQTPDGLVRVDVVGEPLFVRHVCANVASFDSPVFLRTINNIPPSSWGGFTLQVGRVLSTAPALRIYVDQNNTLVIGLSLP
jgi:hypothetical protein